MKVKEIMTTTVVHADAETPVTDVAELLSKHRISAVPVLDDTGAVIGLVSEHDLLAKPGRRARDVMTPEVISVSEDTDVDDVRYLLVERRIRRVPVLSGQELVGIVSRSDIVREMALEWVCEVCGQPVRGLHRPDRCPECGASGERFERQAPPPGD